MEHVEYVYTEGIDEEEIDQLLEGRGHGVLALARDDDAYAVPLNYLYDGSRLFVRVSDEPESTKMAYAESTEMATFIVYEMDDMGNSWSVMIRGEIRPLSAEEQARFTDTEINERFPPFRLFDQAVPEVEMLIYELNPYEITGRKTTN